MKNSFSKNFLTWLIIFTVLMFFAQVFIEAGEQAKYPEIEYSQFLDRVKNNEVSHVSIDGSIIKGYHLKGELTKGGNFSTNSPSTENLIKTLEEKAVKFDYQREDSTSSNIWLLIINWLPMILLIGVWIYMMRQMQGGGSKDGKGSGGGGFGPFGFGKNRSKMLNESQKKVTFADVAGVEEAKEELKEVVDFLKDPTKFTKLGAKLPRGALLVGPPGTGKTLLARAIAGEAGVPFFSISGSDFVEMFVGVGASRVRDMFEQGKRHAPCIIFIDEIDAVGRKRSNGAGGSHEEREQTLNQLLVEMDGFEANDGVIIIAATNRADVLDPALLRPGRFDRQIVVSSPDVAGREAILNVHLRKLPLAPDVDPRIIARGTPGFSGAELANLANEAALLAARRNKKLITMRELEEAKDKVMMGVERKSMVMSDDEKKLTAYHEAGHAVVALHCPASDPIHKATIIPRGRALGLVMRLPERDRLSVSIEKLEADLAVAMGGRVAEEMIFGEQKVTTGAQSDISMATNLAENMVMRWGMSPKLGPIDYSDEEGQFITKDKVSSDTKKVIDSEIKRIVTDGHARAAKILTENRKDLEVVAQALLEFETLSGDEIKDLLIGRKPVRASVNEEAPLRKSALPSGGVVKEIKNKEDRPNA
jgi:cell division protease FtsH